MGAVLRAVEAKMQSDDETTATQLAILLNRCGVSISLSTIKRSRQILDGCFMALVAVNLHENPTR